ncbi:MAG TPA: STAS/SEC14 domain-containing protein [Cyclobacteriaceae bacterium]
MQIYFETEFITISYNKASHSSIVKWNLPPMSEEYRKGLNALLLCMKHFKTGKVVADLTNFGTLHPDDQEWSSTEWTEKAMELGYSDIAIILSSDVYSQMAIEDTMSPVTNTLNVAYFDNIEKAVEWIK